MLDSSRADPPQAIDVVVLWVDGNDPLLAEKRNKYLKEENLTSTHSAALPTRFASSDEIRYCILSILSFASFVRKIFLVSDGQDPALGRELEKYFPARKDALEIVDHKELFRGYEDYLPSFNSTSISSLIWRIRGLAENFIYFNDDVFLVRESQPSHWFIGNRPVMRGKWKPLPIKKITSDKLKIFINKGIKGKSDYQPRLSFYLRQWNAARLLGYRSRYYFHDHTPHPMNRKTLEKYFSENREILEQNLGYRFRHRDQFLITALANHLEIKDQNRQLAPLNSVYIHPWYSDLRLNSKIDRIQEDESIQSICVQSIDMLDSQIKDRIYNWMKLILKLEDDKK